MALQVIKSGNLPSGFLQATNVPATTIDPWVGGGLGHDEGDEVTRVINNIELIYRATANIISIPPDSLDPPETKKEPAQWVLVGPTPQYAPFDAQPSTKVTVASPLTYTVALGWLNAIAFLEITGSLINITIEDESVEIYNETFSLDANVVDDYDVYFFDPFVQKTSLIITDLPANMVDPQVSFELSSTSGDVSLGLFLAGYLYTIGTTQWEPEAGILDLSRTVENEENDTLDIERRGFRRTVSLTAWLDTQQFSEVYRRLADLRSTPSLWIPAPDFDYLEALNVYGIYKSFGMVAYRTKKTLVNLQLLGMTLQ